MPVEITSKQADGEVRATITGDFGFETARELLAVCRARLEAGAQGIVIDMSRVSGMSSSGIGTLILLSELAGDDRLKLQLDGCAKEVRDLFASGILDKYFKRSVVGGD